MPKQANARQQELNEAAMDDNSRELRAAFLQAVDNIQQSLPLPEIEAAIIASTPAALRELIPAQVLMDELGGFVARLETGFLVGSELAAEALPKSIRDRVRFAAGSPQVKDWIRLRGGELITGVSNETRKALMRAIESGLDRGVSARTLAQEIRPMIGLNTQGVQSVVSLRRKLEERGRDAAFVERQVERRGDRMIKWRASLIARTESANAISEGRQQLWIQATRDGLMDPRETEKRWLTATDERVCPICMPMHLQIRKLTEPFTTGDRRSIMRPTAHPQCRCTVVINKVVTPMSVAA